MLIADSLETLRKEKNIPIPDGTLVYPNQFLILKDALQPFPAETETHQYSLPLLRCFTSHYGVCF